MRSNASSPIRCSSAGGFGSSSDSCHLVENWRSTDELTSLRLGQTSVFVPIGLLTESDRFLLVSELVRSPFARRLVGFGAIGALGALGLSAMLLQWAPF